MIFFRIRTTSRGADAVGERGRLRRGCTIEAYAEARLNRSALLVDVRGVAGRVPTILDRFEFGTRIAPKHYLEFDPRIRLAVLGHEPMIHPERFGELVARNRGADARVFTDEAEALGWLLERGNDR